jgi:hypothetical protein
MWGPVICETSPPAFRIRCKDWNRTAASLCWPSMTVRFLSSTRFRSAIGSPMRPRRYWKRMPVSTKRCLTTLPARNCTFSRVTFHRPNRPIQAEPALFPLRSTFPLIQSSLILPIGSVHIADSHNFPAATFAAAFVVINPGGMRELHWDPNTDGWQHWIAGQARVTAFSAGGRPRTFDLHAGDTGYVPRGCSPSEESPEAKAGARMRRTQYAQEGALSCISRDIHADVDKRYRTLLHETSSDRAVGF